MYTDWYWQIPMRARAKYYKEGREPDKTKSKQTLVYLLDLPASLEDESRANYILQSVSKGRWKHFRHNPFSSIPFDAASKPFPVSEKKKWYRSSGSGDIREKIKISICYQNQISEYMLGPIKLWPVQATKPGPSLSLQTSTNAGAKPGLQAWPNPANQNGPSLSIQTSIQRWGQAWAGGTFLCGHFSCLSKSRFLPKTVWTSFISFLSKYKRVNIYTMFCFRGVHDVMEVLKFVNTNNENSYFKNLKKFLQFFFKKYIKS